MPQLDLNSQEIERLATLVEEGARAASQSVPRFVEPARGTLRRASSRRHHIVFGRRGSGKTSLLLKAADDLSRGLSPVAYVDLERFKGHQYPDVLISVLIESLESFAKALDDSAAHSGSPSALRALWERVTRRKKIADEVSPSLSIKSVVEELSHQLSLTDDAEVTETKEASQQQSRSTGISLAVPTPGSSTIGATLDDRGERSERLAVQETLRRSKIEFLLNRTLEYSRLMASIPEVAGRDAYLFLDDLYHIRRQDQPHVLDYFHRLFKGNNVWLKVGTVRHRSAWFQAGDPPVGLNIGDDADEINLDVTLEAFGTARTFLTNILSVFITESGAPKASEMFAEGAVDRLVLGSGGVARDFLGLFRRSLDRARARLAERPGHHRGPRIGVEDVNLAIGEYGDNKLQEFNRDTLGDRTELDSLFGEISAFCTEETNANCFLIDQASSNDRLASLNELMDLRLVHLVRSHVTVSGRPGRLFKAYMLDVSLYTGERKRRDLQLVDFWRRGSEEQLRRAGLIFPL